MKIKIEQSPEIDEEEIIIRCGALSDRITALIEQIRLYDFSVIGTKEGRNYRVGLEDIYYIESVEERTYLYRKTDMLESQLRLYELEQQLSGTSFQRISKTCIMNLYHLECVSPQLDGRFEAKLENGEKIIINRHYVKAFKQKFGI